MVCLCSSEMLILTKRRAHPRVSVYTRKKNKEHKNAVFGLKVVYTNALMNLKKKPSFQKKKTLSMSKKVFFPPHPGCTKVHCSQAGC